MNTAELEKRLREKERELLTDIARTEAEAREARTAEVEDRVDLAVSAEAKESLLQSTTFDWTVFAQVREALRRVENGTYGTCVECGRKIEDDRLKSIPWTPFCLNDQYRQDRKKLE